MARTILNPTKIDRVGRLVSEGLPDDPNKYKISVNMANGAYTLDATTPGDSRAHKVTATHLTVVTTDTLGTVTVVGTDINGASITEVLTILADVVVTSAKYFATIVSITQAGWVIAGTNDTIEFGFSDALEAAVPGTSDGHEFSNDGRILILVDNVTDITSGTDRNITIQTPGSVLGLAIAELTVLCLKGQTTVLGPFPTALFNQTSGKLNIDFVVTEADLEVRALRL